MHKYVSLSDTLQGGSKVSWHAAENMKSKLQRRPKDIGKAASMHWI